jgi:hypothetical protein
MTMAGFDATPLEEMPLSSDEPAPTTVGKPAYPVAASDSQLEEIRTLIRTLQGADASTDWKARQGPVGHAGRDAHEDDRRDVAREARPRADNARLERRGGRITLGVVGRHLGLPCSRCGRRERTSEDLYRLVLPDGWTLEDLGPWRERGLTVRQLAELGIRIRKLCLACQSSEDGKP